MRHVNFSLRLPYCRHPSPDTIPEGWIAAHDTYVDCRDIARWAQVCPAAMLRRYRDHPVLSRGSVAIDLAPDAAVAYLQHSPFAGWLRATGEDWVRERVRKGLHAQHHQGSVLVDLELPDDPGPDCVPEMWPLIEKTVDLSQVLRWIRAPRAEAGLRAFAPTGRLEFTRAAMCLIVEAMRSGRYRAWARDVGDDAIMERLQSAMANSYDVYDRLREDDLAAVWPSNHGEGLARTPAKPRTRESLNASVGEESTYAASMCEGESRNVQVSRTGQDGNARRTACIHEEAAQDEGTFTDRDHHDGVPAVHGSDGAQGGDTMTSDIGVMAAEGESASADTGALDQGSTTVNAAANASSRAPEEDEEQSNSDGGEPSPEKPVDMTIDFPVHPAAAIFPLMTPEQIKALGLDMLRNGQRKAITRHRGQVADGRNRFLGCRWAQIPPRYVEWDGEGSIVAWVVSENLHRRHLTNQQRAVVAVNVEKAFAAEAAERSQSNLLQNQGSIDGINGATREEAGRSADKAAKVLNVSAASVKRAKRVLENADPALAEAAASGAVSLSAAAEVAALPKQEQRQLVESGAVKAAAKQARDARKSAKATAVADEPGVPTPDVGVCQTTSAASNLNPDLAKRFEAIAHDLAQLSRDLAGADPDDAALALTALEIVVNHAWGLLLGQVSRDALEPVLRSKALNVLENDPVLFGASAVLADEVE